MHHTRRLTPWGHMTAEKSWQLWQQKLHEARWIILTKSANRSDDGCVYQVTLFIIQELYVYNEKRQAGSSCWYITTQNLIFIHCTRNWDSASFLDYFVNNCRLRLSFYQLFTARFKMSNDNNVIVLERWLLYDTTLYLHKFYRKSACSLNPKNGYWKFMITDIRQYIRWKYINI